MPYDKKYTDTIYNRDWLWKMYIEENRNANQVARIVGCDTGAVLRWLRKFDIPIKDSSEAQKLAPHPGSHAKRLKKKFWDTLHNSGWLKDSYELQGKSASEIAKEVGASVPATIEALQRAGINVRGISRSKIGQLVKKRKCDEELSEIALRKRARNLIPEGPCFICGAVGQHVNHKDRNPRNYSLDNLELLCKKCHSQQHASELHVMIEMLENFEVSYIEIYEAARNKLILSKKL